MAARQAGRWSVSLAAIGMIAVSVVPIVWIEGRPHDGADVAAIFSPWATSEGTFARVIAADGVVVRQGTTEDWIIENRATEGHVFHIHQIHFQVLERDEQAVREPSWRDTIDLPYWDGKSARYPSVKLRMDFREPGLAGTILYHCHILEHEDGGMMGAIRVQPN